MQFRAKFEACLDHVFAAQTNVRRTADGTVGIVTAFAVLEFSKLLALIAAAFGPATQTARWVGTYQFVATIHQKFYHVEVI